MYIKVSFKIPEYDKETMTSSLQEVELFYENVDNKGIGGDGEPDNH